MKFKSIDTFIDDLFLIETDNIINDSRGMFARLFCLNELNEIIGKRVIKQINISKTLERGSIRGMHFQKPPMSEMKLVRCLKGEVWDVAIDLRVQSKTYLKYYATKLSEENMRMLVIPEGFAHGFQTLKDNTELLYLHTEIYSPELESGIRFDDPAVEIDWPMSPTNLSKRDINHVLIDKNFEGINNEM